MEKNRRANLMSTIRKPSTSSSQRTRNTTRTSRPTNTSRAPQSQANRPTPKPDQARLSRDASRPDAKNPVNFGAWANSSPSTGNLRRGAEGAEVKALQESLNARGANLDADGNFGPKTQEALRKFQDENKLSVDGVAGPKTMAALQGQAPAQAAGEAPKATGEAPKVEAGSPAASEKKIGGTEDTAWAEKLPPALRDHAQAFVEAGKKHGVDPRFLAAISMQETGGGKSSAFRNKKNAMGISGKGGPKSFQSIGQSIDVMARTLAKPDGYYKGKSTISQIGGVYAPIGAKNDPRRLNRHWVPNVSENFQALGGDPRLAVK